MNPIDQLAHQAVFGNNSEKQKARFTIWQKGAEKGILPSSIHELYAARGTGKLPNNFTVPAINVRAMAYDMARAIFQAAKANKVGALIFEIARSEMGYTDQRPDEYVAVMTAAALRENWSGPLFIQGDHFQAKASGMGQPKAGEIETIKKLIAEAIQAGFYNIDIDMSTLVNLDKPTETEQQEPNYRYSVELTKLIRQLEPTGVTISVGAEIGHIGGKNSTVADLKAFITGFKKELPSKLAGISKISVQTGTSHGGKVLADGSLADLDVDFTILRNITQACQSKYQIGGSVQHGASTLPDQYFNQFVKFSALEVHLATGFQNLIMDHPAFPQQLLKEMYDYIDSNNSDERKPDQTDEQFHYKLRKKAIGPFKRQLWNLPAETREKIRNSLSERFAFLFKELNVVDTQTLVDKFIKPTTPTKTLADFAPATKTAKAVKGLAD
ncbi:MAG: class II fructose-bisphosphate aldolase [Candidatus Paceibacterota bacterium]